MKDRGLRRLWSALMPLLIGQTFLPAVHCQQARGDDGGGTTALGFDGVVQRHDGYVKGETPTIPQTSFSCSAQPYNPGLYADVETQCQVYHVCFEDRQESFLCGPGTNFNQRILACDFWYNFNCQDSPSFYSANADIGKVPEIVFRPDQPRVSQQPSYPQQPQQPPSGGSYPTRVEIPAPPAQPQQPSRPQTPSYPQRPILQPQPPRIQPQPPRVQPQPPRFQPEPPRIQPQPPRIQPQPPRIQPQPPRIQPEPPRFQPDPPRFQPEPPRFQPEPPRFQPEPPRIQPQPPRIQPEAPRIPPQPEPPRFDPQPPRIPSPSIQPSAIRPRPDPPKGQVSVHQDYPSYPQPSGQPPRVRPQTHVQQETDSGYDFDGNRIQRPVSLPPPRTTPRPVFPPVVSPPRVSRPPLTPAIIRQPEISRPRVPVTASRPDYHPDSNLKGSVDYRPPQSPPPRIPQPSRPVITGYPRYPVAQRPISQQPTPQRPIEIPPSRPAYQPPPTIQQEHVDTEYVPPPQPQRPIQPSRPTTIFVPPPPPPKPVQQEITTFTKPPHQPSRPVYVPPPVAQTPDYGRPQPPVAPSVIIQQQKPVSLPPSRPQAPVSVRPPQPSRRPQQQPRPKPVFPPTSDHPNSNIKGGPGYQQPPPQPPRFEPTRIGRPSSPPQTSRPQPPSSSISVKPITEKRPAASASGGYKQPQPGKTKKPSEPPSSAYQPPIQIVEHPNREIKGNEYDSSIASKQPQRIKSPSTASGVKRPQSTGEYQQQQVQRPRAPIVVSRPHPPSLPSASIKKPSTSDGQTFDNRLQPPASRVKLPSQSQIQRTSRPSQPTFPSHQPVDHPNVNIKGGSEYNQPRPEPQPIIIDHARRPSGPPSSPSTSYQQKITTGNQGQVTGTGYPSSQRRDGGPTQQQIIQQEYKPQRFQKPNTIPASPQVPQQVSSHLKDTASYQRPPSASDHTLHTKQAKPDYGSGSSYTRGPDIYPKPEFGHPSAPLQPISIPSRVSQVAKQGPSSQNSITQTQIKPAYQGSPASSGSGTQVRPDYPFREIPGHQPPHQRQVFPVRENPDHPNESLKGSGAYRPPPPAGFQAAASETHEQKSVPEPEPAATSLLGDIGAE